MPKKKFYTEGMNRNEYDRYLCSGLHRLNVPATTKRQHAKPISPAIDPDLAKVRAMLAKTLGDNELSKSHLDLNPSRQRKK